MYFFLRSGWQVQFLEPDLKTPLPRKFTFADPELGAIQRAGRCWNMRSRKAGVASIEADSGAVCEVEKALRAGGRR
jgi:hypothetical protein